VNPSDATSAIETALAAAWTTTPIAYPNVPFTPPTTGNWLRVDVIWGNGQSWTKDGTNSVVGVLQLAMYGPNDVGDGDLDVAAQAVRAIFNRVRLASPNQDVFFGAASGPVKQNEEEWRSVIVSAPFQVIEHV
jgi:hypothetical protein